jgi:hypothetical protein
MISRVSRRLNAIDPSLLFLAIAILIGGVIRLYSVLRSGFPINDGGLFYTMIKDLMANGYRLPVTTSYNQLNLPFAYPPLFLYLTGFLSDLTSWKLISIIRILPAIFTVLSIPAFYLLVSVLIKDRVRAVFATFIFAFIPSSFDWLVMGGGLTRSPAFFFALFSLYFIYKLYTQNRRQDILWTVLFSSLTVLSHPETALHTVASAGIFFLFFGRNKRGILRSLLVAGLVILVTAPWWVTVLVQDGISPFVAAGKTGVYTFAGILQVFQSSLTHEVGLQTIAALALIGFFWHVAERDYFVPVWALVIFFSEPRSAPLYLCPSVAILASSALFAIFGMLNKKALHPQNEGNAPHPVSGGVSKVLFLLLACLWIFSAMATTFALANTAITKSDKIAFDWIELNTGTKSNFLVLTGLSPLNDPVSEWFPALTGRQSVATVQGVEWDGKNSFEALVSTSLDVQKCLDQTVQCVKYWADSNHIVFQYLYIHNPVTETGSQIGSTSGSALGDLSLAQGYTELVYQNNDVSIFKVK